MTSPGPEASGAVLDPAPDRPGRWPVAAWLLASVAIAAATHSLVARVPPDP